MPMLSADDLIGGLKTKRHGQAADQRRSPAHRREDANFAKLPDSCASKLARAPFALNVKFATARD